MPKYIPDTSSQQEEMLKEIGFKSVDDLYSVVPESVRLKKLNIPFDVYDGSSTITCKIFAKPEDSKQIIKRLKMCGLDLLLEEYKLEDILKCMGIMTGNTIEVKKENN